MVKKIDLANPGEESKPIYIAKYLIESQKDELTSLLKEFQDVLTWTCHEMKGVPPCVVQYSIPINNNDGPVQQQPYPMSPKYVKII